MTREEAIQRLKDGEPFDGIFDLKWDIALDMAIKALSVPEREKGEWIIGVWDKCSVCGTEYSEDIYNISYESDYRPNFCPNCGADMRGKAK